MKGFGLALLVIGLGLIAYAFYAPNFVTAGLSRALVGALTCKILWLLLGGSAATVVGVTMLSQNSIKQQNKN